MIFFDMTPQTPEYIELTISTYVATGNPNISERNFQSFIPPAQQAFVQNPPARVVELPKRRTVNKEFEIPVNTDERIPSNESARNTTERIDPLQGVTRDSQIIRNNQLSSSRLQPGSERIEIGEKVTNPNSSVGISGDLKMDRPYDINWEGGAREVLVDPLPAYPDNIFKEVILKFRIEVLPNGTVNEIIPLQKGEATLENIAKQTLTQWVFNPLENSAPQEKQIGTVTFRFVVK